VQDRWNTHCFTDLSQSRPAKDFCRFRSQKAGLGAGNSVASSGEHNNIMLDQFLDDCDMPLIQRGSRVVSPNYSAHTSYAAVDDIVIKGHIGPPEGSTQVIVNCLVAKPGNQV